MHKSLTYSKNNDVPRIEPCDTPHVICKKPESVPLKGHCIYFGVV